MKFSINIEMNHTFIHTEEFKYEIEANNQQEAVAKAKSRARADKEPDRFESVLDYTDICLVKCEVTYII